MYDVSYILTSNINNKISAKMGKKELVGQATDDQIKEWKNKYGDVFAVQAAGKIGYLRKPKRAELGLAMSYAAVDPLKMTESIVQSCWLGGAPELTSDDKYFLGLNTQINQLIEIEEVAVKKL